VATTSHAYYLEQLDETYVTYLNGDLVEPKPKTYALNHCDRIIFGGSHFFRLVAASLFNHNFNIVATNFYLIM
jgi:hypothetical protein